MNDKNFQKNVERLIDPVSVGSIHFAQTFNQKLPKSVQTKLIESSSKTISSMGFVVEPYSSFLCYEIIDLEKAKELLPRGFKMIKTRIFDDDEPKYYSIFGCFRAHTSAFWGLRNEFYIIAENESTGLLSWIIVDYDSDTISYDKASGLRPPNAPRSVVTTDCKGFVLVDIKNPELNRQMIFSLKVENGVHKKLDQRLWLEGNLSIGYGKVLSKNNADIFSLKFEPCEVEKALKIDDKDLELESNTWYPGLIAEQPSQIVCFPFAQHFVSDSPGFSSNIKDRDELIDAVTKIDFSKIKVMSPKSFQQMIVVGSAVSFIITIILIILLIIK